jgi:general secretion pathway protein N
MTQTARVSRPPGRTPSTVRRAIALVVVTSMAALVCVFLALPAAWLDPALAMLSHGRARLVDTEGTWLRGQGRIVLLDGTAQAATERGFAVPGTLRWEIHPARLLIGEFAGIVQLPAQTRPVAFGAAPGRVWFDAGRLDLPRTDLSALGSPWNTIRPSAALSLSWEAVDWRRGETTPQGRVLVELRDVASAMTPVAPLGDYRIEARTGSGGGGVELVTLAGALRLAGSGRWDPASGLRLQAQAWGEGPERARLQSLLGLIGQRQGEQTLIRIGG